MQQRREARKSTGFSPLKFLKPPLFMRKTGFKVDESEKGLGCLLISSQCAGRGSRIELGDSKTYIVRWVRCRFGFFYRMGLEAI